MAHVTTSVASGAGSVTVEVVSESPWNVSCKVKAVPGTGWRFMKWLVRTYGQQSFVEYGANPLGVNAPTESWWQQYGDDTEVVAYFKPPTGKVLCDGLFGKVMCDASGRVLYDGYTANQQS